MEFVNKFEELPKLVKVILLFFLGWIICGIYRIIKYTQSKNIVTLVVGLLVLFTGIGNGIATIVDIVTEILNDRITVLAD